MRLALALNLAFALTGCATEPEKPAPEIDPFALLFWDAHAWRRSEQPALPDLNKQQENRKRQH